MTLNPLTMERRLRHRCKAGRQLRST